MSSSNNTHENQNQWQAFLTQKNGYPYTISKNDVISSAQKH